MGFYTARMENVQLRVATIEDVVAIRALIDASVRGLQAGDYSAAQIEASLATVFTTDSQLIVDGTYFVAPAEDGLLAGCGGWSKRKTLYGGDRQVERAEPELLDPATEAAKIRAIFVHPDHARKGLGTLVLKAGEDAAAAEGFRELEMGSTLTGLSLYRLKGYVEAERHMAPIGDGLAIEIVKMRKRLY